MNELDLFSSALALPDPAERSAYLDRVCAGDPGLRRRLDELLTAYAGGGSPLDSRPDALTGTAASAENATATFGTDAPAPTAGYPGYDEHVGSVIAGKYKLVEAIGEGGMGSVFLAQQSQPVRRLVAVKVIKAGMDTKAVLARFDAERQALAMMDHPNIAKVLDAGTTEGGRPFFVMELVKGVPITQFCDERRLTPRQRLELFVPVCQAVQHAHQKGVIHRDLKPGNVLVAMYDDRPVPKVIDFGVAKATGPQLTDHTLVTGLGAVVGTPEYMSPEQASFNQLDIDTRSDVYALGVLLYELLTGTTPIDRKSMGKAAVLEVLRMVREVEAPRPSNKLSTSEALPSISANRGLEPKKLTGLLRGELDWIMLKALEKDRTRRYETANGFAADVLRYLAGEQVQAVPPSAGYRLKKFLNKNRGVVTATAVVLVALTVGFAGTGWGLVEARHQRDGADAQRKDAEEARAREAGERAKVEEREKALAAQAVLLEAQTKEAVAARNEADLELHDNQRMMLGRAWEDTVSGDGHRLRSILDEMRPRAGRSDRRGFEAHYLDRLTHPEIGLTTVKSREPATARELTGRNYTPGRLRVTYSNASNHHYFAIDALDLDTGKSPAGFTPIRGRWGSNQFFPSFAYIVPGSPARIFASAHLSPDFSRLNAGGHPEGELTAWDLGSGQLLARCERLYPDLDLIASGWRQRFLSNTCNLGDTCDSRTTRAITEMVRTVPGQNGTPDRHESRAQLHDMKTGRVVLCLAAKPGTLERAGYSFDDRFLYTAHQPKGPGQSHVFTVWDAATGREVWSRPNQFRGFTRDGIYAAFVEPPPSPDAVPPQPKSMPVFDLATGELVPLTQDEPTIFLHPPMPDAIEWGYSPRLTKTPSDRVIRLFEGLGHSARGHSSNQWLNEKGESVTVHKESRLTVGPPGEQANETTFHAITHRAARFEFIPYPETGGRSDQLTFEGAGKSLRLIARAPLRPPFFFGGLHLSRISVFDPITRASTTTILPPEVEFIQVERGLEADLNWHPPVVRGNTILRAAFPRVRRPRDLNDLPFLSMSAVYDLSTGRRRFLRTAEASRVGNVTASGLSPDGRWLIETDPINKELRLLDAETGQLRWRLADEPEPWQQSSNLKFLPDGSRLVACDVLNGTVRVIDVRTGEIVARVDKLFDEVHGKSASWGGAEITPDGRSLLIKDNQSRLVVIDTGTWTVRHRLGTSPTEKTEHMHWNVGRPALSNRFVLSDVSRRFQSNLYEVWNLFTGQKLGRFELELRAPLTEYTVSEDGARVFLLCNDVVHVVDPARGREVLRLPRGSHPPTQQTTPREPVTAHMELNGDGQELTVYSCWTKANIVVKRVYDARPLSADELARSKEIAAAPVRVQPPVPEPPGPPNKPETASDYFDLAKSLMQDDVRAGRKRDVKAAARAFREAITRDPDFFVLYNGLATALLAAGDAQGGLAAYRESVKRYPLDVDVWYRIGQILGGRRDFSGAVAAYREAFRNDDRTGIADAWHGMNGWNGGPTVSRAKLHDALGGALLEVNDPVAAENECREAVRLEPTQWAHARQLITSLLGQSKFEEADKEAKGFVNRAEESRRKGMTPQPPNIDEVVASEMMNVGQAYLYAKPHRPTEAVEWFERAVQRLAVAKPPQPGQPDNSSPKKWLRWNYAIALNWLDRGVDAIGQMDLALKHAEPGEVPFWGMMRARYQAKTAAWRDAERAVETLLKTPPAPKPTWFLWDAALAYAQCSRRAGEAKQRDRYAESAVKLLNQAVANGWDDLPLLLWDPDVQPLRDRTDFQELVTDLKKKVAPKAEVAPPPREKK